MKAHMFTKTRILNSDNGPIPYSTLFSSVDPYSLTKKTIPN